MEALISFSSLPKSPSFPNVPTTTNRRKNLSPHSSLLKDLYTRKQSPPKTRKPQHQNPPTKKHSLHEIIFKPLLHFISTTFTDADIPPYLDPNQVLSGNLSPVDELPPTACAVVEGSLPPCLAGAYVQNGPNPRFTPQPPYIFPDGDGMLHSLKISRRGDAVFCSRFIKTFKYTTEQGYGYPIFPNIVAYFCSNVTPLMILTAARVLLGQFNPFADGLGTANTSLSLIGGGLHALMETDLPYQVKITPEGEITTVGRHDFKSSNRYLTMTAHPKTDPDTGESFAFRYFVIPPFLTYFRIDSNGKKQRDVPIFSLKSPSYIHDFAVTKSHAIFPDPQIVIEPLQILRGKPVLRINGDKVPKLGVIRRDAEDEREMYWIDEPGMNLLHVVNAWDEDDGDTIVVVASNIQPVEHALEKLDLVHLSLEKIVIDAKTKKITMRSPLSALSLDFGVINPRYAQKKNRYVYVAVMEKMPRMVGLVKMDLSLPTGECTVGCRMYGAGCYGSEPIFVAREGAEEEDDGYLVTYVSNEKTQETHFVVMDAKSPNLEIVAAVKLPRRVPQGFHSIFVKETDLQTL
ncbi:zeaxanthin 7,8(7',8')-cleavage dioxygenase, chromoplastic-like [Salvia hispanica]|uniref:zeaxanthin 7,8(7',8')-cleavage dioxygenase, chromoplastic-like n=1 Tax=Salvia hispanica TaxID=49212 RepID=UPI0020090A8E|nr:zeaxanthin 7,8(7',8')-cleavage dioxygenase, chromoplastic-like [Salvia hispanica]